MMTRFLLLVLCGVLPVVAAPVFREDFREVPAHIPAVAEDLSSPFLRFKIFGPGKDKVKLSNHPEVKNDPHYLWNGDCAGPVVLAFPFEHVLDLSAKDSVLRLRCKNVGKSSLHVALKVGGEWLVTKEGLSGDKNWTEHELMFGALEWRVLDVKKAVIGVVAKKVSLGEVEAIGFVAPVRPKRSKDCIRLDWFEVESSSAKVEGMKEGSLPKGGFIENETPFLRTALVAEEEGKVNRVRRGVVVPLGYNLWGCFDPDLLRWAAVWETKPGEMPITMDSMAAVSYPDQKAKAKRAPRLRGRVLRSSGEEPGAFLVGGLREGFRRGRLIDSADPVGPLRSEFGRWIGISMAGRQPVLHYRIGDVDVSEVIASSGPGRVERLIRVSGGSKEIRIAFDQSSDRKAGRPAAHADTEGDGVRLLEVAGENSFLQVEPSAEVRVIRVVWSGEKLEDDFSEAVFPEGTVADPIFPEGLKAAGAKMDEGQVPFRVRHFPLPVDKVRGRAIRPTDVAFLSDGTGMLCTLDGDVWRIEGLDGTEARWTRVATGLFEPMGIEVDGKDRVFVLGRDQVTELIDGNGDGHIDVYRNASDAFQQTMHTRDYALSFALEPDGSFLVAKGGIYSAKDSGDSELSGHRGTVLRLSADGEKATVLADGLRMPYVGRRADGSVFASDQQGHYVPSTPLLELTKGTPCLGHEPTKFRREMKTTEPVLWYPYQVNRSGAGFATLPAEGFPDLGETFAQVSWSGRLFPIVTPEAGLPFSWRLPVQFDFPTLNAATHPKTGELFVVGLGISGYKPTTPRLSGLAAIRQSGSMVVPAELRVSETKTVVRFAKPLSAGQTVTLSSYRVWNIKRRSAYGSGHFRWDGSAGEHAIAAEGVRLSADRRSLEIKTRPVFRSHILALDLYVSDGERSYPLNLFARPGHLKEPTSRDLAEVKTREKSAASVEAGNVERGKLIFTQFACAGCHSLSGEKLAGPSLKGVATRHEGALDEFLRESILEPGKVVAEGYEAAMPSFSGVIPAQGLEDLIVYLKGLK